MSACARCKRSKLRCDMGVSGCERCLKAGFTCLAMPTANLRKRLLPSGGEAGAAEAGAPLPPERLLPAGVALILADFVKEWGRDAARSHFALGFFSSESFSLSPAAARACVVWLVRHWVGLSRAYNSHALMRYAIRLATAHAVPVSSAIHGTTPALLPAGSRAPAQLSTAVAALDGFAYMRAIHPCADGSFPAVANAAFLQAVASMDALARPSGGGASGSLPDFDDGLSLVLHTADIPAVACVLAPPPPRAPPAHARASSSPHILSPPSHRRRARGTAPHRAARLLATRRPRPRSCPPPHRPTARTGGAGTTSAPSSPRRAPPPPR
jgi:hypothetical protein